MSCSSRFQLKEDNELKIRRIRCCASGQGGMETEEWRRRNGDGGMVWSLASDRDLKVPVPRFSAHIEGSRNLIADQIFIPLREHFFSRGLSP